MKKFILLYRGPATPAGKMDPGKAKEVMRAWGEWMERVGKNLVDVGQPMEPCNSVALLDDGSEAEAEQLNGYSVIEAESLDNAKDMVRDHPFLSDKTGKFSVDVYELLPNPEM
ncbi:hypothetical protein EPO04_03445 [Patescibacteria group bacterium]|nr:MAG: hypothetical protein EPO04_03445 [Patescibacteria group bacterium]